MEIVRWVKFNKGEKDTLMTLIKECKEADNSKMEFAKKVSEVYELPLMEAVIVADNFYK